MNIKTIDVIAREWFDKKNGNSYFAGTVTINYGLNSQKNYDLPYQYGYGDHYIDMAKNILINEKSCNMDQFTPLWQYCNDNNIILRCHKTENCKKRDLLAA